MLSDLDEREQGEKYIGQIKSDPSRLPTLVQIGSVASNQDVSIRKAALLCFGRAVNDIEITTVQQDILKQISVCLIECAKGETCEDMKGTVAAALSNFAQVLSDAKLAWNDYFQSLLQIMQDPRPVQQMICLETLAVSSTVDGFEQLAQFRPQIIAYCTKVLNEGTVSLKMSVLNFLQGAVILLEGDSERDAVAIKQLLAPTVSFLMQLLQNNMFDEFDNASAVFCEVVENADYLFTGSEVQVATQFFQVACQAKSKETQQSSLEIAVSIICSSPSLFKKQQCPILTSVVQLLLQWMQTIDKDSAEDLLKGEDPVDLENWQYAEDAFTRIVEAVGGKPIKDVLFNTAMQNLRSTEWNARYAALVSLSLAVQDGKFIFKNTMSDLLKLVIPYIHDNNPIVIYGLLELLEELIEAFPKMSRRRHFNEIIEVTIIALNSTFNLIQDKACFVLNAILEEDEKTAQSLQPFVQRLMGGIFATLSSQNLNAISSALSILVFITRVIGKPMESYYQTVEQVVNGLLPNCTTKETQEHKGKLIEIMCMYTILNTQFFPNSRQLLLETFESVCKSPDVNSPILLYVLGGIAKFCEANDAAFKQYLKPIIQILLTRLQIKDGENIAVDGISAIGSSDYAEEKQLLLQTLFRIATSIKAEYGPFVNDTLNVILPLMNYINNEVRLVTAHLIPAVFEDALLMVKANGEIGRASCRERV